MTTVTFKVPAVMMSAAVIAAVSCAPFTNVVVRGLPVIFTVEPGTKLLPFTVSVNAAPPVATLDGERVVIAGTGKTVCLSTADVLALKVPSPLYIAVIGSPPTGSYEVIRVATAEALSVLVPREVVPLKNVTVPVGVPATSFPFTVAVNVTCWPINEGLADEPSITMGPPREISHAPRPWVAAARIWVLLFRSSS
ncbi:MAG TPA: hypothetical protein VGT24_01100 [Candidatus Acidoferrales bacterium]|nr:hypothetical protein [Candidatus Acidoferrales bacterium]